MGVRDIPIFDMHADVFMDIVRQVERRELKGSALETAAQETPSPLMQHLERMRRGGIAGAVLTDCRMAGESADTSHLERFIRTVRAELAAAGDRAVQVLSAADLQRAREAGGFAVIVGYEGLSASGGDVAWIDRLYRETGLRVAALTHNDDNPFGAGAATGSPLCADLRGRTPESGTGLTPTGFAAVEEMNALGILIDMAHAGRGTRRDILAASTRPVMLSHTSSAQVYDTGRNLSDAEARRIADAGGLIGCMTSPTALAPMEDRAHHSLARYIEHLRRLIDAAGIGHVGLGLHFCEYLYTPEVYPPVCGLEDASQSRSILEELDRAGYREDEIELIAWKNFARTFEEAAG